jgi:hypothetical protein
MIPALFGLQDWLLKDCWAIFEKEIGWGWGSCHLQEGACKQHLWVFLCLFQLIPIFPQLFKFTKSFPSQCLATPGYPCMIPLLPLLWIYPVNSYRLSYLNLSIPSQERFMRAGMVSYTVTTLSSTRPNTGPGMWKSLNHCLFYLFDEHMWNLEEFT